MWVMDLAVKKISDNSVVRVEADVRFESRRLADDYFFQVFSTLNKGEYLSGSLTHNGTMFILDPSGWGSIWFLKKFQPIEG